MSVKKYTYPSGKTTWSYIFDAPGSSRAIRRQISAFGFSTKGAATNAEAQRRLDEQKRYELVKAGRVDSSLPKTLSMLLDEFFTEHADKKLAPKTVERYRQQAPYLSMELLAMPLPEITALLLNREWSRLLESGGHNRKDRKPRPLSAKTVRNISSMVSSAFARAIRWGLIDRNPASDSEPPIPKKHYGIALTAAQQSLIFEAATTPWCLPMFLRMAASIAARRGEVLALRWSDINDGRVTITRSLTQTKQVLEFKSTKTDNPHTVTVPKSVLYALEDHRKIQDEFRRQFGPSYRADLDLIFANPDGTRLKPDSVSAAVSRLFRRLKLPKGTSLHSLRHTHASHLLADGVPLPVVSERLGHSSVRVTAEIYSHAIHGQDDEAARKWDEFQRVNAPHEPACKAPPER